MQALLLHLLENGFRRKYPQEFEDPREVATLVIVSGPVVVEVNLVARTVTVSWPGQTHTRRVAPEPMRAAAQVARYMLRMAAKSEEEDDVSMETSASRDVLEKFPITQFNLN